MQYQQTDLVDRKICPVCSSPLPVHPAAGRPSVYCKEACKKRAMRLRRKVSSISLVSEKAPRISKKTIQSVVDFPVSEKFVGVSGTVHAFPVTDSKPALTPAPVIRSFDDLKSFFGCK